ncbi:MAG TPA: hypothetical protein VG294_12485 [Solirubrobacteraceae bacterium]|nr:hypothetical protein [Solirubrobacteraceae bacterium]
MSDRIVTFTCRRAAHALLVAAVILAVAPTASAAGLRPLRLAFTDGLFVGPTQSLWLQRAAGAGAQIVRLDAGWPAARAPADPSNPTDPAYDFTTLDSSVRNAAADGLTPLLSFTSAPAWAQGPHRPASAPPGSWLPDPGAIEAYGRALAERYNGQFRDPLGSGSVLPKVTLFQLWNEPNLPQYLSPQWQKVSGHWVAVAPNHYRLMLNAFYAGVKAVQPGATVVTAGTAPFGDFGHGQRMMPVLFWSQVLRQPTSFDVLAHQPYSVGPPSTRALNANDVSIPDIGKLTTLLRRAERRGDALPRGLHHPVWVTETGYNTKPPNPGGIAVATAARWLEQTVYLLWSQGVSVVTQYLIRDEPPIPSYDQSSQSGVYYLDGAPKPSLTAFRFPLVGHRATTGHVRAWLRAPVAGRLSVFARRSGRWTAVTTVSVKQDEILDLPVPGKPSALRASEAGLSSLVWTM